MSNDAVSVGTIGRLLALCYNHSIKIEKEAQNKEKTIKKHENTAPPGKESLITIDSDDDDEIDTSQKSPSDLIKDFISDYDKSFSHNLINCLKTIFCCMTKWLAAGEKAYHDEHTKEKIKEIADHGVIRQALAQAASNPIITLPHAKDVYLCRCGVVLPRYRIFQELHSGRYTFQLVEPWYGNYKNQPQKTRKVVIFDNQTRTHHSFLSPTEVARLQKNNALSANHGIEPASLERVKELATSILEAFNSPDNQKKSTIALNKRKEKLHTKNSSDFYHRTPDKKPDNKGNPKMDAITTPPLTPSTPCTKQAKIITKNDASRLKNLSDKRKKEENIPNDIFHDITFSDKKNKRHSSPAGQSRNKKYIKNNEQSSPTHFHQKPKESEKNLDKDNKLPKFNLDESKTDQ